MYCSELYVLSCYVKIMQTVFRRVASINQWKYSIYTIAASEVVCFVHEVSHRPPPWPAVFD
jgi:hypothetical protein